MRIFLTSEDVCWSLFPPNKCITASLDVEKLFSNNKNY